MLLVCTSFVLIVMVLIPLVQEKESGVKVRVLHHQSRFGLHYWVIGAQFFTDTPYTYECVVPTQYIYLFCQSTISYQLWNLFLSNLFQEFLRIATSLSYLNDVSLFLLAMFVLLFLWVFICILAKCYGFLGHVDLISLFLLTLCYLLSAVSFTFMVSVMFPSVFYAKVGSMLAFAMSFLVCWLNREKTRWLMPIFNNAMVVDTFSMIDSYGKRGINMQLESVWERDRLTWRGSFFRSDIQIGGEWQRALRRFLQSPWDLWNIFMRYGCVFGLVLLHLEHFPWNVWYSSAVLLSSNGNQFCFRCRIITNGNHFRCLSHCSVAVRDSDRNRLKPKTPKKDWNCHRTRPFGFVD